MRAFSSTAARPCCGRADAKLAPRSARPARSIACCAAAVPSRRDALGAIAAVAALAGGPARAFDSATLYGMDTPPTSYGGYGGNSNETPKYRFEYPTGWKRLTVNKVQKVRGPIGTWLVR